MKVLDYLNRKIQSELEALTFPSAVSGLTFHYSIASKTTSYPFIVFTNIDAFTDYDLGVNKFLNTRYQFSAYINEENPSNPSKIYDILEVVSNHFLAFTYYDAINGWSIDCSVIDSFIGPIRFKDDHYWQGNLDILFKLGENRS